MADMETYESLFDAYLNNELSQKDRINFEERLKNDSDFKKAFNEHQLFQSDLEKSFTYIQFKESLNQGLNSKQSKPFILRPYFLIPVSAAALIALIVLIVQPFALQKGEMAMESTSANDDFYSPTATEEASISADSMSYDDGYMTLKNAESEMYQEKEEELRGNAFLIYGNDILITTVDIPSEIKEVKLKTLEKTFQGEIISRNNKSGISFIKLKIESIPKKELMHFEISDNESLPQPEVNVLCYQEMAMRQFQFTRLHTNAINFSDRKKDNELDLIFNPEYVGGPVIDLDKKLIGIVANKKSLDKSVTYFISSYYIGIELDNLLTEQPELKKTMTDIKYLKDTDDAENKRLIFAVYY